METIKTKEQIHESYLRAKKRVEKIKGFYIHLGVYIIINLLILVMKYIDVMDTFDYFWEWDTFDVAFFWGIGLFFHFINVFGFNVILGKNWEEQKIKELMEKDKFENFK